VPVCARGWLRTLEGNVSDPSVAKYKAVVADVNAILYNEWAPIGCVGLLPDDEYEAYATRVVSMLVSGAGHDEIADYLAKAAASITGNPLPVTSVLPVARKLVGFRDAARTIAL